MMSAMSRSIWFIYDEYVGVKCICDQDAWLVASLLKSVCEWRKYRMLRARPHAWRWSCRSSGGIS